jgi:hypothetical protein
LALGIQLDVGSRVSIATSKAGEWQPDVHAAGVALKLNDGTGPYAFNCGAPAFRFTEERLVNDIGPRLVAMVRNIEAALGGLALSSSEQDKEDRKNKEDKENNKRLNQEEKLLVRPRGLGSL